MRNFTELRAALYFPEFKIRCKRYGCLSPLVTLRWMRDMVRRKRCSEPAPPVARLLGHEYANFSAVNAAVFALQIVIVFACNASKSNKEVSDKYKTLVTPASWAFLIWPLIYVAELAAVVHMIITVEDQLVAAISPAWVMGNLLQAAWAIAFRHEQLSLAAALLTALSVAMCECMRVLLQGGAIELDRLLVLLPIALHAGWVCAAALVSWNMAAVAHGARLSLQLSLAFLTLHAAAALAVCALLLPLDERTGLAAPLTFGVSLAWALTAIGHEVEQQGQIHLILPVRRALYTTAACAASVVIVTLILKESAMLGKARVPIAYS
jgi:hypothetical protein